jgi:hypothetical protein
MTANSPQRSSVQELLQPLKEIMELLGVETAVEAVDAIKRMQADLCSADFLLSNLSVASVVLVADRPLFVQLPPNMPQEQYAPQALEMVRDALVEASVSLRIPLARSRAAKEAETDDDR